MIREADDIDLDPKYKAITRKIIVSARTSEELAAHVVVYKSLNIGKEFALFCMMELARRRSLGDDFNFEKYIEVEVEKIPKVNFLNISQISKGAGMNIASLANIIKGDKK